MMITIHGLPPKTTFQAVKTLVKQECNIIDFILDSLVEDGPNARKIRIGVSDDSEGYRIIKYLNGFRMSPMHLLKVVPVGKPLNPPPEQGYNQRPSYSNEPPNDYQSQSVSRPDYQSSMDNYGKDMRKGNYVPPNMRSKNIVGKQEQMNAGPLRQPEIRPPNLERGSGIHSSGSHISVTNSLGTHGLSSHISGSHGPSSHIPGPNLRVSGSHGHNSHSSSLNISGPYGSGLSSHVPAAHSSSFHTPSSHISGSDVRSSSQWSQDMNAGRGESEWGPSSQEGMQGQSAYNQRPSQGFGQPQLQGPEDPYASSQGRGPPAQGFGFQTKPVPVQERLAPPTQQCDTRQHVLRAVDIVDTPPARPYAPEKPITIMKDNFQGPQYGNPTQGNYSAPVWDMSQQPKSQYDDRHPPIDKRVDPSKPEFEKHGRFVPIGSSRPVSPTNRGYQEPSRQYSDRRVSPSRLGPPVREFSPSGKRYSPGRKTSPGRRYSPGRKMSPPDRRISPSRRFSPGRKTSPARFSPGRKRSPVRFSPRKSPGRFGGDRKMSPGRFGGGRKVSPRRFSPGRKMSPGRFSSERKTSPEKTGEGNLPRYTIKVWTLQADELRKKARQMFNRATNTNRLEDWDNFKHAQKLYRNEVNKMRRKETKKKKKKLDAAAHAKAMKGIDDDSGQEEQDDRSEQMDRSDSPRRYSPARPSPTRRLVSPTRPRFSPNRLGDKSSANFLDDEAGAKRMAYEPNQAQNQYTGGFHDSVQYTRQDIRPTGHASWQNEKIIFASSAKEEDRRDVRDVRRLDKPMENSPRRSRSPIKDRFRRHSPSPRSRSSRSPRRSWALEKRSPEAIREPPPPPSWPGQEQDPPRRPTRFNSPTQAPKHSDVWDRPHEPRPFQEKIRVRSDLDEPRQFQDKPRVRSELQEKFPARIEFEGRRDFREEDRKQLDRDREFRHDDRPEPRRQSPRSPRRGERDTTKTVFTEIDKQFQDIYARAVEFRKKTEERQRSTDRHKTDDQYEQEQRPSKNLEQEGWNTRNKRVALTPGVKAKRDKAVDEILARILNKYDMTEDQNKRVTEEMKLALSRIFKEMFADKDVSFIELVIKYQAKYSPKEEEELVQEVLSNLPTQYRNLKRKADRIDTSENSAKTSRRSPPRPAKEEIRPRPKLADAKLLPEWQTNLEPPKVMNMSLSVAPAVNMAAPGMVPPPVYVAAPHQMPANVYNQPMQFDMPQMMPSYSANSMQQQFFANQQMFANTSQQFVATQPPAVAADTYEPEESMQSNEGYVLYLCQDDFEPFSSSQAEILKNYIFKQIMKQTELCNGWAPDIILKGLQSAYRYEISTKDEKSRDWIVNLDFSDFDFFTVLVYTKEELWYERAAIWLPGHSRSRVAPLDKLKLQNRFLTDISINKWKFVKTVVTLKGTRLYVDMPPSAARALEKHKMMLSYELQKVSVFLKAVAVDKDVFDAGLKVTSIPESMQRTTAVQNSPMPILNVKTEPSVVKIGLNGQKTLTVETARKLKEVIIYHLFKYLNLQVNLRTDFIKYGLVPPNCLGIVPENAESKKWLLSRDFGKMKRATIVVYGDDSDTKTYFRMIVDIPFENQDVSSATSATSARERIKHSNQGLKGMHYNFWKPIKVERVRHRWTLEVDVDLESVETLAKMKYILDFVAQNGVIKTIIFRPDCSYSKLEEKIKKCKMEQVDSYDIANMELDSDSDQDNNSQ